MCYNPIKIIKWCMVSQRCGEKGSRFESGTTAITVIGKAETEAIGQESEKAFSVGKDPTISQETCHTLRQPFFGQWEKRVIAMRLHVLLLRFLLLEKAHFLSVKKRVEEEVGRKEIHYEKKTTSESKVIIFKREDL